MFVLLNGVAVWFLFCLASRDHAILKSALAMGKPGSESAIDLSKIPRTVTSDVAIALIGASAVQLGAIAYLIAKFLFDDRRSTKAKD